MRAAFEFRDDSWLRDDACEALEGAGAAWMLAGRIASLDARDAFVFFNNDPLAAAPADAAALAELLAERGCEVARPLQADSDPAGT